MADYAIRTDIEKVFGKDNVKKWASISGNGSADEITSRIAWALENATALINDRLYGGPYDIPFVATLPTQIVNQCATMAGVMLYEARGVADSEDSNEGSHKLRNHRKNFSAFIKGILAGQIRFPALATSISYPKAIIDGN